MRLLVLGELAIIKDSAISEAESRARMDFITDLVFNAEHFQWTAILRLHAAVLREVEMGNLKWGDSYSHMSQLILTPFPKERSNHVKGDRTHSGTPRLWYCKDFNQATCTLPDKHLITLSNGNSVEARHFCSKCYTEAKEQANHACNSDDCPRK